jgi:hypothetical protein
MNNDASQVPGQEEYLKYTEEEKKLLLEEIEMRENASPKIELSQELKNFKILTENMFKKDNTSN